MSPADKELAKSIFCKQITYDTNQYNKMFDRHILSYYTNEEIDNLIEQYMIRDIEYRIKEMITVNGDVVKIEY